MRILRPLFGTLGLVAMGMLLAEGLLHLVPSPVQYASLHEFDDPASLLGIEIVPSTQAVIREPCLTALNTTNGLGWRDRERTVEKPGGFVRIAALGDSFVESSQVEDDKTVTRQLEEMLGTDRVEVLNFGLSSIGTVQEDILYEQVVSRFDPDIVLLFFYQNDVLDNSRELSSTAGSAHLTYRDDTGALVRPHVESSPLFSFRKWLRLHSATFRLLKLADRTVRAMFSEATPTAARPSYPLQYGVFERAPNEKWENAWVETERALKRLKERMKPERDFVLVIIPDIVQIAHDPKALIESEFGAMPPSSFDPLLPSRRMREIATRLDVRTIDLLPHFLAKRDELRLDYPYFSFTCDGHWNASGQRLAAEVIADVLSPLIDAKHEL